MNPIACADLSDFLTTFATGEVDHIITSPPYAGLPGRADTTELVNLLLAATPSILADRGTLTMIIGSAPGNLMTPYRIAHDIPYASHGRLKLHSLYVWDRTGTMKRSVDAQTVTHDLIIHACRTHIHDRSALAQTSIIKTNQAGFNFGNGVTMPADLAAFLVDAVSEQGDLIIDPLAGLGEVGVQALHQGRRFAGCDLSAACVEIANARLREHLPVMVQV